MHSPVNDTLVDDMRRELNELKSRIEDLEANRGEVKLVYATDQWHYIGTTNVNE